MWSDFESQCQIKAQQILGVSKGGLNANKDTTWWNNDIKEIIKHKREMFKNWQRFKLEEDHIEYKKVKAIAKAAVAQARAASRQNLYDRLENAENEQTIFKIAKQRHKSTLDIKYNKYIKNSKGDLLTSNDNINNRWEEYYKELLNEEYPSEELPPIPPVQGPINIIHPAEIKTAIAKMKNHKSMGPDNVPADLWKKLGDNAMPWLTELFNKILIEGSIPDSWRSSFLCPIYKNKGDIAQCNNYRGIKLTSHTLKIWERVIGARITALTSLTDNQFGFVTGKSTTDAIQTIRILMEKHRHNKENLYFVFIDLEKAFDRVPRKLVWQALRAQCIPESYITIIQDMYTNVLTQVKNPAGLSKHFHVRVGVHQGSALSPLLFNISMDYITREIQGPTPWCILYADDIALISRSASDLQGTFNRWVDEIERHGLRISRTKTEYMECDYGGTDALGCDITIENTPLPKVSQFKYLGSVLTTDANVDEDVTHRVNTAWLKWRSLTGVLCDPRMPIKTKGKIYKTVVRPALMYGSECWTMKKAHEQQMHVAEMKMLRWAGGVTRLDKVRNEHIRGSFKVAPIAEKLKETRLRWFGHVMRREDDYAVKKAMHIPSQSRGRGRPPATWWSNIEKEMKAQNLTTSTTRDRISWRRSTRRPDPS
ncbi:hypothetical protein JYU34_020747 [Plutella xylostella]|uniref:RNA-directed RNA polymerase n=1 Tax=Plutella xylostella TaxID=51655 RepID=A0ABQ7PWJ0_PLUXY|nr:hypothetical protein JYU34_020747 [Plutella xylostella]